MNQLATRLLIIATLATLAFVVGTRAGEAKKPAHIARDIPSCDGAASLAEKAPFCDSPFAKEYQNTPVIAWYSMATTFVICSPDCRTTVSTVRDGENSKDAMRFWMKSDGSPKRFLFDEAPLVSRIELLESSVN